MTICKTTYVELLYTNYVASEIITWLSFLMPPTPSLSPTSGSTLMQCTYNQWIDPHNHHVTLWPTYSTCGPSLDKIGPFSLICLHNICVWPHGIKWGLTMNDNVPKRNLVTPIKVGSFINFWVWMVLLYSPQHTTPSGQVFPHSHDWCTCKRLG